MVRLNFNQMLPIQELVALTHKLVTTTPMLWKTTALVSTKRAQAVWMRWRVITILRLQFQMHSVACIQRRIMIVRAIALTSQHVIMSTILHPGRKRQ